MSGACGTIKHRRRLAKAESRITIVVLALRESEEILTGGSGHHAAQENAIILEAGQIDLLASLLPDIECLHLYNTRHPLLFPQ